ncbi:choice-of-anchor A family protein [Aquabacterium sp.]|uniref:choice-of-anchor A family protein n=1 Tax=Aquabacterium sp. TaxID=1872578 RepID=UPI0037846962
MRRLALIAAVLATPLAHAAPVNLGLASSLNLLAFGNMNVSSSDVEGRVAVGGNATISGYSINTKTGSSALYAGTGLTVGGNLNFSSGSIWGGAEIGGSYTPVASGNIIGGVSHSVGFDFAGEHTRLAQLSQAWDAFTNTGSAADQWGTLHFDATQQTLAVFDIAAADLLKNLQIDNLATGAQVLINVHGGTVDFGNHGYTGFNKGQVIFNLVDATNVSFNGGVNASLLALNATVNPGWGQFNGQLVVNNWNSSVQVNDAPLPGTPNTGGAGGGTVPEPATLALVGLGLGLAAASRARRRA